MNVIQRLLHHARPKDEPVQHEIEELNGHSERALKRAQSAIRRASGVLDDYADEEARRKR